MKKTGLETLYILILSAILATIAIFVYTPAGGLFAESDLNNEENEIDLADAKMIFISGKALWIDARPEDAYSRGHVPGAINIPLPGPVGLRQKLYDKWDKDKFIVTYCSSFSCPIAKHLSAEMKFVGFSRVFVYSGGYADWVENNMPVEKSTEVLK